jgi:hypothetical protein
MSTYLIQGQPEKAANPHTWQPTLDGLVRNESRKVIYTNLDTAMICVIVANGRFVRPKKLRVPTVLLQREYSRQLA